MAAKVDARAEVDTGSAGVREVVRSTANSRASERFKRSDQVRDFL
jgi:hypothetical protein